jgi:hypothetical protein
MNDSTVCVEGPLFLRITLRSSRLVWHEPATGRFYAADPFGTAVFEYVVQTYLGRKRNANFVPYGHFDAQFSVDEELTPDEVGPTETLTCDERSMRIVTHQWLIACRARGAYTLLALLEDEGFFRVEPGHKPYV